jgi:hypothetical protein
MAVKMDIRSCVSGTKRSHLQLSSPSNIPGMPTKSSGIPNSASASILSGWSRASRDAKPGVVYWPLARPVFGISRSFGGFGGGGKALE